MEIYSWNVNGIRAIEKKGGLATFFTHYKPDILCIQETKAQKNQLTEEIIAQEGYYSYFAEAEKKGYSGVCIYSKQKADFVSLMGIEEFDAEGRYIELHFKDNILINCYFPNSQEKGKRLEYKMRFNLALKEKIDGYTKNGKKIIVCGDFNVAHSEIDLTNPKTNTKNPGFLPEERHFMDELLVDYYDTFRYLYPEKIQYTWWSYRFNSREKNIGWRIDYFVINEHIKSKLIDAKILNEVHGSDHCPLMIELEDL